MKLIGISGLARSGKTLTTEMFLEILNSPFNRHYNQPNYRWETKAFADPIKDMLQTLGLSLADIEKYKTKVHPVLGKTTRELMQTLGTDWGRGHDKDFWLNVMKNKLTYKDNVIISDVRFHNEAQFIRDNHGLMIHVSGRGGLPGFHVSEQLLPFNENDIHIDNSGSKHKLYDKVRSLYVPIHSHFEFQELTGKL